jgi:hypothetical protein
MKELIKKTIENAQAYDLIFRALAAQDKDEEINPVPRKCGWICIIVFPFIFYRESIEAYKRKTLPAKYKDLVIARLCYAKGGNLYANSFVTVNDIMSLIWEFDEHQISFTREGIKYIEEYFGWGKIHKKYLKEAGKSSLPERSQQELIDWLDV